MTIRHTKTGAVVHAIQDHDWLFEAEDEDSGDFCECWEKDGVRYWAHDGWEDAYTPLPHDAIPDIELERVKRDRAERMKIQPTQLWFRPADMDLETVKKIIGVTTDAL